MKSRFLLSSLTLFVCLFTCSQTASAATVAVKAGFDGAAPAAEKIKTDADPKCKAMHPNGLDADDVIVNADGTLKNVFVYVKEGVPAKKYDVPKTPVVFDQVGCHYTPKVFGIQTGQPLEIRNSDDTLHNVHALPTASQQFNLGMPIKGMKLTKKFDKPEVMVKIKCEVHPWMHAYAGVLDHPFFAVTGDNGTAEIKDLPAGEYTIEAWHEKYGTQTQKVTVADADQALELKFKA